MWKYCERQGSLEDAPTDLIKGHKHVEIRPGAARWVEPGRQAWVYGHSPTPHMTFIGKRTPAAKVAATHRNRSADPCQGTHTHMGLLFDPFSQPVPSGSYVCGTTLRCLPTVDTRRMAPIHALTFQEMFLEIRHRGLPPGNPFDTAGEDPPYGPPTTR
jgi:hypothetical protein